MWHHNTHKVSLPSNPQNTPDGVTIGEPRKTEVYSSEQLKEMGMVGVYTEKGVSDRVVNIL